jgi:hypothetical protein
MIGAGSANFATENSNAPGNGARRLHLETELRKLLLEQSQDLFLIFEDGVQAALVFQDGALILLDGVLVGLDLFLVGDDRLLIVENLFLIGDDGALGHVVYAPPWCEVGEEYHGGRRKTSRPNVRRIFAWPPLRVNSAYRLFARATSCAIIDLEKNP